MSLIMRHEVASKEVFIEGFEIRLVKLDNAQLIDVGLCFLLDHIVEVMIPSGKGYSHLKGNGYEEMVDTG